MPCTLKTFRHRETQSESNEIGKWKNACVVEAHESARTRIGKTQQKDHENRIAGKGFNSSSRHNLVHKFSPMLQAVRPDAKTAADKE